MSEVELAKIVIEWLRCDGWNVYEEVRTGYGEHRADIVGERHGITHVVEVKKTLSIAVLAQAYNWKWQTHYVSVAVPKTKKQIGRYMRDRGREFANRICRHYGIGLLEINQYNKVKNVINPTLNRTAKKDYKFIGTFLHELHADYGRAGSTNYYFTPFRETCRSLTKAVEKHPDGIKFKAAVDIIKEDWHYSSEQSGRSALGKFLEKDGSKVLPKIDARMEGRSYMLYYIEDPEPGPDAGDEDDEFRSRS